jgi:hypothetical protein
MSGREQIRGEKERAALARVPWISLRRERRSDDADARQTKILQVVGSKFVGKMNRMAFSRILHVFLRTFSVLRPRTYDKLRFERVDNSWRVRLLRFVRLSESS